MSQDERDEGGLAAANAIVTTGVAAVAVANPIVAVAAAALPGLFGLAIEKWTERGDRRAREWWRRYVEMRPGLSDAGARAELNEGMNDPHMYGPLLESVKAMLDAITDEVAPALGALAALYIGEKRPPDRFLRGTLRTLMDIELGELAQLRAFVVAAVAVAKRERAGARIEVHGAGDGIAFISQSDLYSSPEEQSAPIHVSPYLLELLLRHGLLYSSSHVFGIKAGNTWDSEYIGHIDAGQATALLGIVGDTASSQPDTNAR